MEKRLTFTAPNGVRLTGVLHLPAGPAVTGVILCHGMLAHKDGPKHVGLASRMAERGHLALRFDFSGRGESPGDLLGLTFTRQVVECEAALGELRRHGATTIALAGSSMGGAVAILIATRGEISALATIAAIGRTDLLPERVAGEKGVAAWKRRGSLRFEGVPVGFSLVEDARQIDLLAAAANIRCPWLILHGDADEVIPVSDAHELHEAAGKRALLEIVPGADHLFSQSAQRERLLDRVADFLDEALTR